MLRSAIGNAIFAWSEIQTSGAMVKTNTLISLAAALAASATLMAQAPVVTLTNAAVQVVNSTTITVNGELAGDMTMGVALNAENTSGTARVINVKRYELNVPHGTTNYFCWDLCYAERNAGASPLWIGADPIPMAAGATATGFHAYYKPMGHAGTATFRYVWYDMNNTNDSTSVDIVFNATEPAGIAEASAVKGFNAWPNPSTGGSITFSYDLGAGAQGVRLAVYNLLGERKVVKPLGAAQGQVVLGEGELGSGVWFAVLERNGRALATKRIVVAQ